ncbi:MAG: hypothetical protein IJQ12_02530 [Lachnospiraceae bacterium]|nr:hypothetical protein [Lachnospiraceae bacterium]
MKVTDCAIGLKEIIAGVMIFVLLGVMCIVLMQPAEVSASGGMTKILTAGVNKLDDSYDRMSLTLPDRAATLDLNDKDVTVDSIIGNGAPLTISGRGSLTVTGTVRMTDTTLIIDVAPTATVSMQGSVFVSGGTLELREGSILLGGSYVYAATIRITGGDIAISAKNDALRAEEAFLLEGGNVLAEGGIHGLHAEGSVSVTGGAISLSGGNHAMYLADETRLTITRTLPVAGGRSQTETEPIDAADAVSPGYRTVTIGSVLQGAGASAGAAQTLQPSRQTQAGTAAQGSSQRASQQTQAQAGTGTSSAATGNTQTGTGTSAQTQSAQTGTAAQESSQRASQQTQAQAGTGTSSAATGNTQAQAGTAAQGSSQRASQQTQTQASSSQAMFGASSLLSSPTGTPAGTGSSTQTPRTTDVAQGTGSSSPVGTGNSTQTQPPAGTGSSTQIQTPPGTGAPNAAPAAVTSLETPVMGSNDLLYYGIILICGAVTALIIVTGKVFFNETNKKRRP